MRELNYKNNIFKTNEEKVKIKNAEKNFYEVTFKNIGGLVTPLIIEWTFEDGSKEIERIPAEIWRSNENEVTKVFVKNKVVQNIKLDPFLETADTNISDNNIGIIDSIPLRLIKHCWLNLIELSCKIYSLGRKI